MIQGIKYVNEGNGDRACVLRYHQAERIGLGFREHNKTAFNEDIAQFPRRVVDQNTLVTADGEIQSKFAIGFEVEKNRLHRGAVKEYPLFSHFETDSSCGYEAVTNVLPLIPKSMWRTKVFNMFTEAKRIIDDRYSPSDDRNGSGQFRCGGHMTISVDGMSGRDLLETLKPYCGIIYALYRFRLRNTYCSSNLFMDEDRSDMVNYHSDKYQPCKVMSNRIEFRLPSKISSTKDMRDRYELMYEMVDFTINDGRGFGMLLRKLKPLLTRIYNGDVEKVKEVTELAKHFQKMLKTRKINKHVVKFVDKYSRLRGHWDRTLLREWDRRNS